MRDLKCARKLLGVGHQRNAYADPSPVRVAHSANTETLFIHPRRPVPTIHLSSPLTPKHTAKPAAVQANSSNSQIPVDPPCGGWSHPTDRHDSVAPTRKSRTASIIPGLVDGGNVLARGSSLRAARTSVQVTTGPRNHTSNSIAHEPRTALRLATICNTSSSSFQRSVHQST